MDTSALFVSFRGCQIFRRIGGDEGEGLRGLRSLKLEGRSWRVHMSKGQSKGAVGTPGV